MLLFYGRMEPATVKYLKYELARFIVAKVSIQFRRNLECLSKALEKLTLLGFAVGWVVRSGKLYRPEKS